DKFEKLKADSSGLTGCLLTS
ncbi:hypothetical protein TNCT_567581, partial [Trichonephila clavata]